MKKLMLVVGFAAITGCAIVGEEVLSTEGKEFTYVSSATKEGNNVALTTTSVFVGERIVKNGAGICSRETSVLNSIYKIQHLGMEIQRPDVSVQRVQVTCPA